MSDIELLKTYRMKEDLDFKCTVLGVNESGDIVTNLFRPNKHDMNSKFSKDLFLKLFEMDVEQGRKDDSSKLRYSLLPVGTVNQVVQVLEFGSKKYADHNWQKVPSANTRYYDAALRHIDAWFSGELKDSETGLPHLAHAICCLMFLMWFDSEANQ